MNQLFKIQISYYNFFNKCSEPIQTNHASKLNIHPIKLLINQYVEMKHIKSTHDIVIYVETQFEKTTSNMVPSFSPFWSDALLKAYPAKGYNT